MGDEVRGIDGLHPGLAFAEILGQLAGNDGCARHGWVNAPS